MRLLFATYSTNIILYQNTSRDAIILRMKVLLTTKELHGTEGSIKAVCDKYGAEFAYKEGTELTREDLLDADVILGNPGTELLTDLPKLKLLNLLSAGADNFAALPIFHGKDAPVLCNVSGCYGVTISEHMVGFILALIRDFLPYRDNMAAHEWRFVKTPDTIYGKKALVIGLGDIGGHFARLMHAFGCEVYAIKRTMTPPPEYIKEIRPLANLNDLLPEMDYVALCVPQGPDTRHIINKETLALMKPTACVINVGRGSAVDCMALADALKNDRLAGAALDVTEPEPLPEDHPLWECKNCLITPHASGRSIQKDPHLRINALWIENLEAFFTGKPLKNIVDIKTGY